MRVKKPSRKPPPQAFACGQVVHTVALLAALLALAVGLWQGSHWLVVCKRTFLSYLAFFSVGGVLALIVGLWGLPQPPDEIDPAGTRRRKGSPPEEVPPTAVEDADPGTERAKSLTP
jgi:hypothetical protein